MVDSPNLEELDAAQQGLPGADAPALDADTRAALIAQLLSGRADAEGLIIRAGGIGVFCSAAGKKHNGVRSYYQA